MRMVRYEGYSSGLRRPLRPVVRRRAILAGVLGVTGVAMAGCGSAPVAVPGPAPLSEDQPAPGAETPAVTAPTVEAVPETRPTPEPVLSRLEPTGITQPFWSGDGTRVLFYNQPAPGQSGTWSVNLVSGTVGRELPEWGYWRARGTLVATPRPATRETEVRHVASGRVWTLPASGGVVFSSDGTLVAYSAGGLVVAGADNQEARRVRLPGGGSPVAWLPGTDGTPNRRLLLSGRMASGAGQAEATPTPEATAGPAGPGTDLAAWAADLRTGAVNQLARSRRLLGVLTSPDGTWMAHVAAWNADPGENGLWVTRTDGNARRRLGLTGSYRWTVDNRLLVLPVRGAPGDSHEVWEVRPETGAMRRLTDPAATPFRVANYDWDCSPNGRDIVFVSAEDRGLWHLELPDGIGTEASPPAVAAPQPAGSNGHPYRLPFAVAPSMSGWYVAQWYGVSTGGYRWRNSAYAQGQGIHFGIDFAAPFGTPVVAVAPGKVIAIDGDYGSPPHNVVLQLVDGNQAVYGHLSERTPYVREGQLVDAGQVIGTTGDSSPPYNGTRNPHLHLEIRKRGRRTATNPVPYVDANWDDFGLGVWPGPLFAKDLNHPTRHQFIDDQPDITFGGPILTNFARPWPP
jgi:hypothetical protein